MHHRFKVLVGFIAFLASSASSLMVPALAASPAPVSWTGCYIGANAGYGFAPTTWSANGITYASHTPGSAVGGGQGGCDFQNGSWVFGIQGMFDAASMTGSSSNFFLNPTGQVIDTTKVSSFATVTGRIAFTPDSQSLLYAKGGVAFVRTKFVECCTPTVLVFDSIGSIDDGIASVTRTGFVVGFGYERLFAPNWSAFVEYNLIGLGNGGVRFDPINGAPGPFIYHIGQDVHAVLAGVNFHFNGSGRP